MTLAAIARRELGALFRSPIAWTVLAGAQALVAFIFLLHLESYLQVQAELKARAGGPGVTAYLMPRVYGAAAVIHLFAVPLLTMRLVAGEWRNRTLPLLLSAPVSTLEIVGGKYLGVMGLVAAMVGLNTLMPASLALFTDLDAGALALAALGSLLLAAAAAALGLYLSTLTREPVVAAIATLGLLLGLLMLGEWGSQHGGPQAPVLGYPALSTHLEPFVSGLFDTGALAFFVLFAGLFLALAVRRLDNHRLTGHR